MAGIVGRRSCCDEAVLIVASVVIATLAGFAQSVSGFGFSLLSVPLLIPFIGAQGAVVAATTLSFLLTVGSSWHQRSHVQWRPVAVVSATAVVGMPIGLLALHYLDGRWLSLLIGCVVIGMTLQFARRRQRAIAGRAVGVAGAVSGVLLTSTAMNGPPLVLALQGMGLAPRQFRASLQAAFVVQDAVAVGGFALVGQISQDAMIVAAAGIPGLIIGWLIGDRAFARISPETFRRIVLVMLAASGTLAVAQAIAS